jgi:HTH-type transcriptional regulator / antitoxin HigA
VNVFVPAEPFPPGEYIQDEIDARGWAIDDLAEVTGISRRQLINLIQAKSGITPETAKALAEAFGQEAQEWMNLQAAYELACSAQEDRGIARRAKIFAKAPIRELKRRGWIADTNDIDELEQNLCRLLSIGSIDEQPNLAVAAKKGTSYDADTASQIAWYCRCRELAVGVGAAKYTDANWEPGVSELMSLCEREEDVRLVPKLLADIGIRLVLVQHLRQTKVDGVALWLDEYSPVVALSLRYDRIDNFWFALLHELIHIKYRDIAPPIDVDIENAGELPDIEIRANTEAANRLVPPDKLDSFIGRVRPHYYQTKIVQFAQARKVHPGIVVGQLHRRGELKYQQLRKLLVRVKNYLAGNALTDGWQSALQDE